MLPAGCFGVLFCAATLPLRRKRLSRNNMGTSAAHELCLMLFTAFLAGLFALIVQSSGKSSGGLHYNLIPFQIIADLASELHAGIWMGFWISFLGNIVMFLPRTALAQNYLSDRTADRSLHLTHHRVVPASPGTQHRYRRPLAQHVGHSNWICTISDLGRTETAVGNSL